MPDAWDGRPEHPERDGWHWLDEHPHFWRANGSEWLTNHETLQTQTPFDVASEGWTYLGPCLTPADVAARIAEAEAAGWAACKKAAVLAARQAPIPEDSGHIEAYGRLAGCLESAFAIDSLPDLAPMALARAIAEAVAQEREACALVALERDDGMAVWPDGEDIADAIRARKDGTP